MSMQTQVLGTFGEQLLLKQQAGQAGGVDLKKLVTQIAGSREQRKPGGKAPAMPKGFRFTAPSLVRPVLSVQDDAIRQQALAGLEEFRSQIGPYMQDLATSVRQIQQLSEDERALASGDWDALQLAIAEALNASDTLAKSLATLAYADAMVRTCPEGRGWVIETLADLVGKAFLTDDGPKPTVGQFRAKNHQVMAYSRVYGIAESFRKNDEALSVLEAIRGLVGRAVQAGREYFEAQRDQTIALAGPEEGQLSLAELEAGKPGLRHLPIPKQEWSDREGQKRFRKPGGIVIQVQPGERGAVIVMVAGYGGVEQDAERIRSANVFVTPVSLKHERPNLPRMEQPQFGAAINFHRLVRLGVIEAGKQVERRKKAETFNAACRAEREALAAKATLTPEQFLLEEKAGSAVVEWRPGAFLWRNRRDPENRKPLPDLKVWFCMALVERDEQGRIRVAECPDRLVPFWAGRRDFEAPGPDYSELGKLGVILRRAKQRAETPVADEPEASDEDAAGEEGAVAAE